MDRNEALRKYKDEYQASAIASAKDLKWQGSGRTCDEGKISQRVYEKALRRINYFRTICGLPKVTLKDEYKLLAQKAAFLAYVNNTLDHFPSENWKCYSDDSRKASGYSSLAFFDFSYNAKTSFITAFIEDHGEPNKSVGHRRALLYSRANYMGYGATIKTEAIYDGGLSLRSSVDSTALPKFYAYPTMGYNEIDLVFPKWSFSIPDVYSVDFSQASVVLVDTKTREHLEIYVMPYKSIFDPTLVWEIKTKMKKDDMLRTTISVAIRDVIVNGVKREYIYEVKFFDYANESGG